MRRYSAFVWLATMGASCGFASLGTHAATPESTAVQANDNSVRSSGNPLWGVSINSLTATRERPIFSPSRRPPLAIPPAPVALPIATPPTPAAPEEIPLTLLGTIVGRDNGIAICFNPSTKDVIRLKIGESFEGWVLRSVHGREAAFEKVSLHARLALPSPDDPQVPASPLAMPMTPPLPPPIQANVPASGTWKDGDGQMIAPPPGARAQLGLSAVPANPPARGTWMDGDGQTIATPPKAR